jgi:hypothetical protein
MPGVYQEKAMRQSVLGAVLRLATVVSSAGRAIKISCVRLIAALVLGGAAVSTVQAATFFSTGDPDGRIGTASGTVASGPATETADDFLLTSSMTVTGASFTGLLTGAATTANIGVVGVEIYRVFPADSSNQPSGDVPTRVNSPADIALGSWDSTVGGGLTFASSGLSATFTVANTVVTGINQSPNQTTGGDGAATGQEVRFDIVLTTPLSLLPDHYFFVPQVAMSAGNFLWLSAPRPIVPPGTPFASDLQTWIRDADLAPDWLRVGTDIVGGTSAPTFNAVFSLVGTPTNVPEPATVALLGLGLAGMRRVLRQHR